MKIVRMTTGDWGKVKAFFDVEVESFTIKASSIFELIFFGIITKQPVCLSLTIEFKNLLSSFKVKSSKLFAIVNLVKGLYSRVVTLNLLKGKINLSRISSSIFISIILFDWELEEMSKPVIFFIINILTTEK